MAIKLIVLGISGASIDVLHIALRNAQVPIAPYSLRLLPVTHPMQLPLQDRSLSCQVSKIYYMYITLIAMLSRMSYYYFVSVTYRS